jgi:hypothetical protein
MTKYIDQIFDDRLKDLPRGPDGRPDPVAESELASEIGQKFWCTVANIIVPPMGHLQRPGSSASTRFERGMARLSAQAHQLSHKLMKEFLETPDLRSGTHFRVREAFKDCYWRSEKQDNMHIPIYTIRGFVRLELGHPPNPYHGPFTSRYRLPEWVNGRLNEEIWTGDDALDQDFLEFTDPIGRGELGMMEWVRYWQETINDPERFEKRFPGMAHRRMNLAQATSPLFELDAIADFDAINTAIAWLEKLMQSEFEENRLPASKPGTDQAA